MMLWEETEQLSVGSNTCLLCCKKRTLPSVLCWEEVLLRRCPSKDEGEQFELQLL